MIPSRLTKRDLDSTTRSVSPPPSRRKINSSESVNHVKVEDANGLCQDEIKIVSWNVNGVGPFLQKRLHAVNTSTLRIHLKRHGWPQLLCLQEVKISAKDTATQRRLRNCANDGRYQGEPMYEVVYSLPRDPHNATGFGGKVHGVASLVRSDFAPTITTTRRPDWDFEGRILVHETASRLVIFNGYWVNGTEVPWRNAQGDTDGTRHELKLRYHTNVLKEVLDYQRQGLHVLLVGDMNVALDERDGHPRLRTMPLQHVINRQDFNAKFFEEPHGMQGIDVFRHFHGDSRKYTYHSTHRPWGESCDRVDHIIASQSLITATALVDSNICDSQQDAAHSDHVPLWVKMKLPPSSLLDMQITQKLPKEKPCVKCSDGPNYDTRTTHKQRKKEAKGGPETPPSPHHDECSEV